MPKERIEDLGRLAELLKVIGDLDVLELYNQCPKDFVDWFSTLHDDVKEDVLHDLAYGIRDVQEKVAECEVIARGLED